MGSLHNFLLLMQLFFYHQTNLLLFKLYILEFQTKVNLTM